jgi:hypothetical protein
MLFDLLRHVFHFEPFTTRLAGLIAETSLFDTESPARWPGPSFNTLGDETQPFKAHCAKASTRNFPVRLRRPHACAGERTIVSTSGQQEKQTRRREPAGWCHPDRRAGEHQLSAVFARRKSSPMAATKAAASSEKRLGEIWGTRPLIWHREGADGVKLKTDNMDLH